MKKKDQDKFIKEILKLKSKIITDKVDEIFRNQPDNPIAALEEIGFKYYDDDDFEEVEEKNAIAENQDEQDLVDFFEAGQGVSKSHLETYFRVRDTVKTI